MSVRFKILLGFCLLALLGISFYVAGYAKPSSQKDLRAITKLDSFVPGEAMQRDIDGSYISSGGSNQGKDMAELAEHADSLYIPVQQREGTTKRFFDNEYGVSSGDGLDIALDDSTVLELAYDNKKRTAEFVVPSYELLLNNNIVSTTQVPVVTIKDLPPDASLKIGEEAPVDLSSYSGGASFSLGTIRDEGIELFAQHSKNMLAPDVASFETGLWTDKALDCSNQLPGKPDMTVVTSRDASDGRRALLISSRNHDAGTYKSFPVRMSRENLYRFSFDYKSVTGHKAQYLLVMKNARGEERSTRSGKIDTSDSKWHTFSTEIDPGFDDVSAVDIYLYAPSDGKESIANLYDNVRLSEFVKSDAPSVSGDLVSNTHLTLKTSSGIALKEGANTVAFNPGEGTLLSPDVASFETGLWTDKALDCSNQLPGKPDMTVVTSRDASDGRRALLISSRNHYAGTYKSFPVKMSRDNLYKFSFDYKSVTGHKAQYYLVMKNARGEERSTRSGKIDTSDSKWHTFSTEIDPGFDDVSSVDIYLYAPSDGKESIANLYDNVRLKTSCPKNLENCYLHAQRQTSAFSAPRSVEYRQINKYRVKVVVHDVSGSLLLTFAEKYGSNWKLYVISVKSTMKPERLSVPASYRVSPVNTNMQATRQQVRQFIAEGKISAAGTKFISKDSDASIRNDNLSGSAFTAALAGKPIAETRHFELSGYENAWLINIGELARSGSLKDVKDGSYDVELVIESTTLARFYSIFLVLGIATVSCLAVYLFILRIQGRRRKACQSLSAGVV